MKKCLPVLMFLLMTVFVTAQVVINEISYNPPETQQDSLEYIELYNTGTSSADLSGFQFTSGVDLVFDNDIFIEPNGYLVVCNNPDAMMNVFGVEAILWDGGGINNSGESITLKDASGTIVDTLLFDDSAPWPSSAEGTDAEGASIELCDASSDNSDGANWRAATNDVGVMIEGRVVRGTPGAANTVSCETAADHTVNAMGLSFTPADITIQLGETVRWENTGGNHNVNGGLDVYPDNPEGFFSGAPQAAPWTWDYTFNIPGVYTYQCDLHVGGGMIGTVTVEGDLEPPVQLVITEIMYNDPGEDSLEFIELVNLGEDVINLEGLTFSNGIVHTFAAQELNSGDVVVLAKYPEEIMAAFGIEAIAWTDGSLSNGGELIELVNADGVLIDAVMYDDEAGWSEQADGLGSSLVLCDPEGDNNLASNWGASSYSTDITVMGVAIFANPQASNFCVYTVDEITQTDANGLLTFDGPVRVLGRALGINLTPSGLQFTITDEAGDGIALYNGNESFGYDAVVEGDLLYVTGSVTQFRGLAQIVLTNVEFVSTDGPTPTAVVVTSLGEDTESQLVTLENVHLVDNIEWSGLGSGFNVRVTDGSPDTFAVRIDADVDLYGMGYPQGTFTVTGIGGQFDSSVPHDSGYQLLPRYMEDITPYDQFIEEFPEYDIPTITTVDANGVADSLGRKVTLTGISHGINWRPNGLQFWIIDENNNGIQVFNFTGDLGYDIKEGDNLTIKGTIDQFEGQTEIIPSEIIINSEGQDLVTPSDLVGESVAALDESFESKYVTADGAFQLIDDSQWAGNGGSFTVTMTNGPSTFDVFIDADTEFASMVDPPGTLMSITGIVGQSDDDEPYDSGYAIWVRYAFDLNVINAVIDTDDSDLVRLFPNPANDLLSLSTELTVEKIEILDYTGRQIQIISSPSNQIDISNLLNGSYFLRLHSGNDQFIHRFVKMK